MNPKVLLFLDALDRGPVRLEGELPASILELSEVSSCRNVGPVSYRLLAEKKGEEVLVRGEVEAPLELECSRSGVFFSTIVRDSAFLRDYSLSECGDSVDVTADLREAVLLKIPLYPVSPEALSRDFSLPSLPGDEAPPTGSRIWEALDTLHLPQP